MSEELNRVMKAQERDSDMRDIRNIKSGLAKMGSGIKGLSVPKHREDKLRSKYPEHFSEDVVVEGKTPGSDDAHRFMLKDKIAQLKKEGKPAVAQENRLQALVAKRKAEKRGIVMEDTELDEEGGRWVYDNNGKAHEVSAAEAAAKRKETLERVKGKKPEEQKPEDEEVKEDTLMEVKPNKVTPPPKHFNSVAGNVSHEPKKQEVALGISQSGKHGWFTNNMMAISLSPEEHAQFSKDPVAAKAHAAKFGFKLKEEVMTESVITIGTPRTGINADLLDRVREYGVPADPTDTVQEVNTYTAGAMTKLAGWIDTQGEITEATVPKVIPMGSARHPAADPSHPHHADWKAAKPKPVRKMSWKDYHKEPRVSAHEKPISAEDAFNAVKKEGIGEADHTVYAHNVHHMHNGKKVAAKHIGTYHSINGERDMGFTDDDPNAGDTEEIFHHIVHRDSENPKKLHVFQTGHAKNWHGIDEETELDEGVSGSIRKFVRSTVLGNARAVIQKSKHDTMAAAHKEINDSDENGDVSGWQGRHERASNRTEKAWKKAHEAVNLVGDELDENRMGPAAIGFKVPKTAADPAKERELRKQEKSIKVNRGDSREPEFSPSQRDGELGKGSRGAYGVKVEGVDFKTIFISKVGKAIANPKKPITKTLEDPFKKKLIQNEEVELEEGLAYHPTKAAYGLRHTAWKGKEGGGRLTTVETWHKSPEARQKYRDKVEQRDDFHEFVSTSNPNMREETELTELSKGTLKSYKKKAAFDVASANATIGSFNKTEPEKAKAAAVRTKRIKGFQLADSKLQKEETAVNENTQPYHAGYAAAKDGKSVKTNPHDLMTVNGMLWRQGHKDQKKDSKKGAPLGHAFKEETELTEGDLRLVSIYKNKKGEAHTLWQTGQYEYHMTPSKQSVSGHFPKTKTWNKSLEDVHKELTENGFKIHHTPLSA